MKRILFFFSILLVLTSCGTYRSLDINKLSTGMTIAQVEYISGPPYKILASNNTHNGNQIVLAYRTYNNDTYALEFWNNYLVGYEYLYNDVQYVPAPAPPTYMPPMGRPIMIIDNRPGRPPHNNGSNNRPTYNSSARSSSGRYSSGSSSSSSNINRPSAGSTTSSSSISGRHSNSISENRKLSSNSSSPENNNSSNVGRTSSGKSDSPSNSSTSLNNKSSGRNSTSSPSSSGRSSSKRNSN